jgi:hypothetical protein
MAEVPILGLQKTTTMSGIKLSLFSQVLALIDQNVVRRLVCQYDTDKYSKGINTWMHVLSMIFMQLAAAKTLRDYSNGLRSAIGRLAIPNSTTSCGCILQSQGWYDSTKSLIGF